MILRSNPNHPENPLRSPRSLFAVNVALALLAATTAGCGSNGGLESVDEGTPGKLDEALWLGTGAVKWPGGVVQVCFQGFSTSERAAIRTAAENSWERAAAINFWGWGTCPTLSSTTTNLIAVTNEDLGGNSGQSTHCTNGNASSCGGAMGQAPAGDYNRVRFAGTTPLARVVIHEFGHALGFEHETDSATGCAQRTGGATSLQWETDVNSIMVAFLSCNDVNKLSTWDILGARMAYGAKSPGSISGTNNLCWNISGGSTATGTSIVGWPCQGTSWNQNWVRPDSSLLVRAETGGTQRCVNIQGGTVGSGFTNLISWSCSNSFTNEQFHFTGVEWRAMGDRCIQAENSTTGSKISLEVCTGGPLQKWDFFESNRRIRLNGTTQCVNVPNGVTTNGTELILWPCSTGTPFPNEVYDFANSYIKFGGKVFNVAGGTIASGNRLILWPASATPNHNDQFTVRGPIQGLGQCVDTSNTTAAEGVQLGVRSCSGSATQQWEYWW